MSLLAVNCERNFLHEMEIFFLYYYSRKFEDRDKNIVTKKKEQETTKLIYRNGNKIFPL